ncbi:MAG: L,D-transpeptidase family protein [Gemmatimonadota bacterium]
MIVVLGGLGLLAGCGRDEPEPTPEPADVYWSDDTLTVAEIEAGRQDSTWRRTVRLDRRTTVVTALDTVPVPEVWEDIGDAAMPGDPGQPADETVRLPLFGDVEGPSVLYVQILLDRARFSPGLLDGKWGKNTEKAVYWFQRREGLPATGIVDSVTLARLRAQAGSPGSFLREHVLTVEDVAGPFVAIPADVYAQRRLDCLCYQSLSEKLGERFHASPAILAELNPGRALDSLATGDSLLVPALRVDRWVVTDTLTAGDGPRVARIVISGLGFYLHALDDQGRVIYHFPTTLGSGYDPSPAGELEVVSVTPDPWFHYQPRLLSGVDRAKPNALLPPGPNNPVGRIWIKLSEPHYGIHGTREPATIGYETSSGCVRLTNWDATFLGARLDPGVVVEFRHTRSPSPEAGPDNPADSRFLPDPT